MDAFSKSWRWGDVFTAVSRSALINCPCSNAGDRSDKAFIHNAYAVLTACRILYTAYHRKLISKDQAYEWAMGIVPPIWCSVIRASRENRLKNSGLTTPELEQDAMRFVGFVAEEVKHILGDRVGP